MRIRGFLQRRREAKALARADATALIEQYAESAYEQARTRARDARHAIVPDPKREAHWNDVRRLIARQTGRAPKPDTATRYLEE